jgi:hypothetical protein
MGAEAVPERSPGEPGQEGRAEERERHLHHGEREERGGAQEAQNCPHEVAGERAHLHREGRAEAAAQAPAERFGEDGAGQGVEEEAQGEGGDEEFEHGGTPVGRLRHHVDPAPAGGQPRSLRAGRQTPGGADLRHFRGEMPKDRASPAREGLPRNGDGGLARGRGGSGGSPPRPRLP